MSENILFEAVRKDPDLDWEQDFVQKARGNAFYQRYMKEAVLSDVSQALGEVQRTAVDAARNMAVGREIIWIIPTSQALQRFYLASRGSVSRVSDSGGLAIGERFTKVDVSLDYEYVYDAAYSRSYLEDVPLPVLQRAIADSAQLLEEQLTSDIMSLYENVAAANLAGGAEITAATPGTLAWRDIVNGWKAVKSAGFSPNVCIVHPDQLVDLWNDDKFIHSFYFGEMVDVEKGVIGGTYLGMKIVATNLAAAARCHILDTNVAAVCIMRRDLMTQPYEVPNELREGVLLSMRYGLGTLRTTGIARITGC